MTDPIDFDKIAEEADAKPLNKLRQVLAQAEQLESSPTPLCAFLVVGIYGEGAVMTVCLGDVPPVTLIGHLGLALHAAEHHVNLEYT